MTTKGVSSTKVCPTLSHRTLFRLCSRRRSTPRLPPGRRTSPSPDENDPSVVYDDLPPSYLFCDAPLTPNCCPLLRSPGRIRDSFLGRPQSLIGQGSMSLGHGKRTRVHLKQCCRRVLDYRPCISLCLCQHV